MHISISLQHSKKAAAAAEAEAGENSGKERKRIDELEAIQVRKWLTSQKSVLGQRETRLRRGLKRPQGWFVREVSSHLHSVLTESKPLLSGVRDERKRKQQLTEMAAMLNVLNKIEK